ncbi:unnamed protein product, partial [marine sediment metagenome]
EPLKLKKPSKIFVCSVSDFWGKGVSQAWREEVYNIIKDCPQHTFQILTKQPHNITTHDCLHCPEDVWLGVTVTSGTPLVKAKSWLIDFVNLKFLSCEPLLGEINLTTFTLMSIDWIILGAQTNPYKPPKIEWMLKILKLARSWDIPIYMKSNLRKVWPDKLIQDLPE